MTGIRPIKKYGEHPAIDIFDEYSMVEPKNLGRYFGSTKEEIGEQCRQQRIDPLDMENGTTDTNWAACASMIPDLSPMH